MTPAPAIGKFCRVMRRIVLVRPIVLVLVLVLETGRGITRPTPVRHWRVDYEHRFAEHRFAEHEHGKRRDKPV